MPEEHTLKTRSGVERCLLALLLLIVGSCAFALYAPALSVGFLLDDFSHLDYAYSALSGDWGPLLRVFTGNWTGAVDNLTAYRPFISLSFTLDALLWKVDPFGYHLSNLIMFALCSILTTLIAFELSAPFSGARARFAMALAAGLLFVFYPLHPEAVVWIIGRVDVQCALFYFSSLYTYLLFRRSGSKVQLTLSLLAFACALPSKEMAVTLPAAIFLAEILLPGKELGWRSLTLKRRAVLVGSYFAALAVFAVIRTAALGTLVGGYGGGGLKQFLRSLGNFADGSTWLKVFYGVNEEMPQPASGLILARGSLIALAAFLPLRFFERLTYWRILAFLLGWMCVSELPTYQIWHVFPNLCGSRLLFIPSAPFCVTLSFLALAPVAFLAAKVRKPIVTLATQIAGGAAVAGLGYAWWLALDTNLVPWTTAGVQMRTLTGQVRSMAEEAGEGKVVLLLDLPQDNSGAGLLGRPEFLERLLRPPLHVKDLREKVLSAESPFPGHNETTGPEMLERLLSNESVWKTFKWSRSEGRYVEWVRPRGSGEFRIDFDRTLDSAAGNSTFWLVKEDLDPFGVRMVEIELESDAAVSSLASSMQLVFKSQNQPKSWIDYSSCNATCAIGNKIIFYPARQRSWLYNGEVRELGLLLPVGTKGTVKSVAGSSGRQLMPLVRFEKSTGETAKKKLQELSLRQVAGGGSLSVEYDCEGIQGARCAAILILAGPLPDLAVMGNMPGARVIELDNGRGLKGKEEIPFALLPESGLCQIAVVALDGEGKPVSFISEPVTVRTGK